MGGFLVLGAAQQIPKEMDNVRDPPEIFQNEFFNFLSTFGQLLVKNNLENFQETRLFDKGRHHICQPRVPSTMFIDQF
jgi:hypothetical protein